MEKTLKIEIEMNSEIYPQKPDVVLCLSNNEFEKISKNRRYIKRMQRLSFLLNHYRINSEDPICELMKNIQTYTLRIIAHANKATQL